MYIYVYIYICIYTCILYIFIYIYTYIYYIYLYIYIHIYVYIHAHNIQTHTPLCYWLFCSFTYLISLHIYTAYIYFFFFMSYRRICFNQPKKKVKKRKKMIQLVRLVYFCWDLIYWLIYFVHKILITVPSNHTWEKFLRVILGSCFCKCKMQIKAR